MTAKDVVEYTCDVCNSGVTLKSQSYPEKWIRIDVHPQFNAPLDGGKYDICDICSRTFVSFMRTGSTRKGYYS